jgi:hypothetical protein
MTAHIQIGAITPRIQYEADGTQTAFAFPFPAFAAADVHVHAGETRITTGFTVSGAGSDGGGTVTFAVAPAAGTRITLLRQMDIERVSDFQAGGPLRAAALNDELDALTAIDQQLAEALSRCVRIGPGSPMAVSLDLPAPTPGTVLGWNDSGDALVNDPLDYAGLAADLASLRVGIPDAVTAAADARAWAEDAALSAWQASLEADAGGPGPTDDLTVASLTTLGNATIGGDLVVNGSTVTVDVETVQVADAVMVLNHGEVGAGVTAGTAGLEVDRGTATAYRLTFRESDDAFVVGEAGTEQAVATRQDSPTADALPFWNDTANRLDSSGLAWTGSVMTYPLAAFKVSSATTGATATVALTDGEFQALTLGADTVFTLPDPPAGHGYSVTLKLIQDATGSRSPTFQQADTTAAVWLSGSAPTWQPTAGDFDLVVLTHDGTDLIAAHAGGSA